MAIKRFIKKPSVPSLTGWPDWAHGVMNPIKQTLEIITGRRGEKLEQLSGEVELDAVAEKINEVIRVLQDGQDVDVSGAASVAPTPQVTVNNITQNVVQQVLSGGVVQTFSQTVGNGTDTSFLVPHNFRTYDVMVMVRTTTAPRTKVEETDYNIAFTTENAVTVTFASAPTAGQYEVFCASFTAGGEVGGQPAAATQVYSTPGVYSFVVPGGVTALTIKVWGAGGGGPHGTGSTFLGRIGGGPGGYAAAILNVTPGETLTVRVGAGGVGGRAYLSPTLLTARQAGGGQLCGVFRGSVLLTSTPLVIAGSGGGASSYNSGTASIWGGIGGGSSGGSAYQGGGPGTQTAGGSAFGSAGSGGYLQGGVSVEPAATQIGHSGNGGDGYFGGGASNSAQTNYAGGGGSGYIPPTGSAMLSSTTIYTNQSSSTNAPPNINDSDYGGGSAGYGGQPGGGNGGVDGQPGRIVLKW